MLGVEGDPWEDMRCQECGRQSPREIIACPQRPSGKCRFPEVFRVRGVFWTTSLVGAAFGVLLLFFGGWLWELGWLPVFLGLCVIVLAAAGLMLVERVGYGNLAAGMQMQRWVWGGSSLGHRWVVRGDALRLAVEWPRQNAYPHSVLALGAKPGSEGDNLCCDVIRAALFGLYAAGLVQFVRYRVQEKQRWRGPRTYDVYTVEWETNPKKGRTQPRNGVVENRIRAVLAGWPGQKQAKEWPGGPPIGTLVRWIKGNSLFSGQDWAARLAAKDAEARGWGRQRGTRFELNEKAARLADWDHSTMADVEQQIRTFYPGFYQAFTDEIRQAL